MPGFLLAPSDQCAAVVFGPRGGASRSGSCKLDVPKSNSCYFLVQSLLAELQAA